MDIDAPRRRIERVKKADKMPASQGGRVMKESPRGFKDSEEQRLKTSEETLDEAFQDYSNNFNSPEEKAKIRTTVEQVVRAGTASPKAHVLLGYLDMDSRNLEGMYRHFIKALDLAQDPHNEYTWDYVIMCLDDGLRDYHRLADYLTRFYDRKPESFVAEYLAKTYIKLNQPQKALVAANRHLESFPEDKKLRRLRDRIEKSMR